GMLDRAQEFGEHETRGRRFDVLAVRPPAVVVDALELGVGDGEQRNIGSHPLVSFRIGDGARYVPGVVAVEVVDVVAERGGVEHVRAAGGGNGEYQRELHAIFRKRTARYGRPGSFMANLPERSPAAVMVISQG